MSRRWNNVEKPFVWSFEAYRLFGIRYLEVGRIASRSSGISKRTCCLGYRISRSIRSRAVRLEFRSAHAVWDTVSRDRSGREPFVWNFEAHMLFGIPYLEIDQIAKPRPLRCSGRKRARPTGP